MRNHILLKSFSYLLNNFLHMPVGSISVDIYNCLVLHLLSLFVIGGCWEIPVEHVHFTWYCHDGVIFALHHIQYLAEWFRCFQESILFRNYLKNGLLPHQKINACIFHGFESAAGNHSTQWWYHNLRPQSMTISKCKKIHICCWYWILFCPHDKQQILHYNSQIHPFSQRLMFEWY